MGVFGAAPTQARYILWVTDHNLVPISQQIDDWTSISVTLRHNEPSSGEITAPSTRELVEAIRTPRARIVLERNGEILLAGPIESTPHQWTADEHGFDGAGDLTVRWADDLALIAGRLSYPNPAQAATAQTIAKWTATGNPEALIRDLVNLNAGPGALTARRIPRLVLGPSAGATGSVTWSTRFQPVTDDMRGIAAISPTRIGFRTQQVGSSIEFQVYLPTDRTQGIWFSRSMGNVVSIEHEPEIAAATVAICGGKDAGANRLILERGTPGDQHRIEVFVDGSGADNATQLSALGDEELANSAEVQRLAVVAADIDGQRYGDYQLGDVVAVEAYPGMPDVPDIVAAVEISVDPDDGETVRPIIGANSAQLLNPAAAVQQQILRALARRGALVEIPA
ncbi:hypothetical protein GCM10011608_09990 [Micromonospora sonchi]|uniref:Gp28/Gp37-like domain-containing protein n=1 Tax=Micromonospora sonchi TaxID=1763543 RepID=A0A917TLX4_9ACTN|nr:siphovirus ReqiPepy6 Gp37-like family protein [Micromonospora sonchi]GGM27224.1 hypothetical protein GCM10011608_09990 [Micromonospora sonchi]